MPSLIPVAPEKQCTATASTGARCQAVRLKGGNLCISHSDRNPEKVRRKKLEEGSPDLDALMALDPTDAVNLQKIRIGLMRHVASGIIEHQAATACLRFAQAAYDAKPHKRDGDSATADVMRSVLSKPPQPDAD